MLSLTKSKVFFLLVFSLFFLTTLFLLPPKIEKWKTKQALQKLKLEKTTWSKAFLNKVQKKEFPEWMLAQIKEDLAPYKNRKITVYNFDLFLKKENPTKFQRFQIKNNQLTYQKSSTHPRINSLAQSFEELLKLVKLPDMDFIISLEDVYNVDLNQTSLIPILTFAKDLACPSGSILIPDFEALEGNWSFLADVIKAKFKYPWKAKTNQAFWRGSTSGEVITRENYQSFPRAKLVALSQKEPSLVDAKFTYLCQGANNLSHLFQGLLSPFVNVQDQLKYKYQILIDGNSCAYSRAYWQLFSDGVIFKQDSSHIQWFYRLLKPYEHYIPFKHDCSDLIEKITWAKQNDEKLKEISLNAQKLAQKNLKKPDIYLYLYLLFSEYAKLFLSEF